MCKRSVASKRSSSEKGFFNWHGVCIFIVSHFILSNFVCLWVGLGRQQTLYIGCDKICRGPTTLKRLETGPLGLASSVFVFPFPLGWVFCSVELARVSSVKGCLALYIYVPVLPNHVCQCLPCTHLETPLTQCRQIRKHVGIMACRLSIQVIPQYLYHSSRYDIYIYIYISNLACSKSQIFGQLLFVCIC